MKTKIHNLIITLAYAVPVVGLAQTSAADSLKRIVRSAKVDTARVNAYNHLANLYRESNPDSATFYAVKAESLSRKAHYDFGTASALLNRGNAHIISGDYKKALDLFRDAQSVFSQLLEDDSDDIQVKNSLGRAFASSAVVLSEQSDYARSLADYQKALQLFTETANKPMMSRAYNNIAIVYKSQSNKEKALEYLQKAFGLQQETGEQAAAVTLMNIGVIHFEKNDPKKAADFYRKAEKLFAETDNQRGFALLYNYWGDYYAKTGDVGKAAEYYNKSVLTYENMQNKFGASLALYNLGRLYRTQPEKALIFAQKSLDYASEIGILNQQYHSEKLLSDLYEDLGKPPEALSHYKKYVTLRDSIFNQESTRKFALAEMNFEYQKKEALLKEQNKRQTQLLLLSALVALLLIGLIVVIYNRRQVKRRLTLQKEVAEYEQKALHLQMNPHFVFNCLGSISSFIVQNGTDSALRYLSKFSKLMRLTLEYSKGSLIPIDKEIESLQNYLELEQLRFHNKFDFEIRSSEKVEFNMGLPPLLVQPFVENAILHGMVPKEGNGRILVDFDVENGQLLCTITDDGIGISHSRQLKENSVTAHKSMALDITKKRLEIMESTTAKSAQIDIAEIDENGKTGTKVTLRLPIQYMP
ncbi:tetratricopeptide repeat protein [Flavobacterium sp. MAH-1]|uniref:Tetratricopeptide repeat protein n=1 Tax=Flavobacterium agri TaxID=2743471 RepID=A0A7Y8Y3Q8_9FLAO|nr:tetratricopeptide repeat protein [Flavobacterium agri]NUY82020.1 tetratricopeptide repeat protein [Flavobacterium agri]NYA72044.1 tetratricopeptide repeat protein [Flavobacterium agri]